MKKKICLLTSMMLLGGVLFSQEKNYDTPQFVSTEPSLKNMLIEEFTGRNCHACPEAHEIANTLMRENPERLFLINIHEALSPETYPNFKTEDGRIITNTIHIGYVPSGLVNRRIGGDISPSFWEGYIYEMSDDVAACNIAGQVVVNEATREATITVEVYYTSDSDFDINYLTVAMTQDSVWGYQNNGQINPEQYVNGEYCHMHTLRDIITSTWGDEIGPTKAGTLITKEYTYNIPIIIGDPNGVDVDLENINFYAFVSDNTDYGISYPIQNVAHLSYLLGTQESVFPYIEKITERQASVCSNSKTFALNMQNRGLDELTSIKMLMETDNGDTFEYEWNGSIPSYKSGIIEFDMDVPIGDHNIDFKIVEANGVSVNSTKSFASSSDDLSVLYLNSENDMITIEIMQDRNGHETTWQLLDDDNNVVASGGPYEYYFGQSSATELHTINVDVTADQCLKFTIYDLVGNGICCDVGDGYYKIYDAHGNLVLDGNGDFGYEASHTLSTVIYDNVDELDDDMYVIYPNPTKDMLTIEGNSMRQITVFNTMGQTVMTFECDNDEVVNIDVESFSAGVYFIRIFGDEGSVVTQKISIAK